LKPASLGFGITGREDRSLWSRLCKTSGLAAKIGAALILLLTVSPSFGQELVGAGATFPEPLYSKWFAGFAERRQDYHIRYEGVGSEEGIRRLREGSADFAASDMPLNDSEIAKLPRPVVQLPSAIGAVVPIYNVEGLSEDLRLSPEALAGIFLGRIRRWNDPAIKTTNRGARLPNQEIHVIHRSDGSGTTYVWTDYLSKVSPQWKSTVGVGATVKWPVGVEATGNEGTAQQVRGTPYSIGYVEFIYALYQKLSYGAIRNSGGRFVSADVESITAAASDPPSVPPNFQVSITNAPGRKSYPVAAFTYLLIPLTMGNAAKDSFLRDFVQWALTSGQRQSPGLGYGSLPPDLVAREQRAIKLLPIAPPDAR
jgi:phosphate transport system substrate-binding protein